MLITQPVEATKSKEFYMDKGVIKTKDAVDIKYSKADSKAVTNIPVIFSCWECEPNHTHFFHQDWKEWNLICNSCGKTFHNMVDVTEYKIVKDIKK